jgi:hypothetical protein
MKDSVKFELFNDKALMALFDELQPKIQDNIIIGGLKNAGKVINDEAKQNFQAIKKNKSKTGYQDLNSMFKVVKMRAPKIGVRVGMSAREGYKYRFMNFGTEERYYMTKNGVEHRTGAIPKREFFTRAVESKKQEAEDNVQNAIKESMEKTVKRYNKK